MKALVATAGLQRQGHLLNSPGWALRWLLALLLGLPVLAAGAQNLPPRPNPPRLVNDLAGLMQPGEADALESKLVAYNDSTSSQIAVVTVPNLGGDEIASYAQALYQSWGIGRKGKDNGILVLVAKEEHTARIQTGYGLEGAVPDALAKRIISNTLVPAFKQEQYYAGLDRATDQLIALAKGEYKADPADARPQGRSRDRGGSGWTFWVVIGMLVLFFHPAQPGWGWRPGPQPGLRRRLHAPHHLRRLLRWPRRIRRRRRIWRRRRRRIRRLRWWQQRRRRRQRQLVDFRF
jgi:uncharacterized membrane protein YgcG